MVREIIIVGKVPPPVGGVTVHTRRLVELLRRGQYQVDMIDIRCKKRFIANIMYIKRCYKRRKSIIHYQLNNWIELLFISKLVKGSLITTVHSFRWDDFSFIRKMCFRILVNKNSISAFIAPSNAIKRILIDKNVKESDIYILPTYLPPVLEEIGQAIPEQILNFIKKGKKKRICILASASNIVLVNKIDIYGLDMCISVCERNENLSFVFCAFSGDRQYIETVNQKIHSCSLDERFLLYIGDVHLPSLYKYFDLFVRPTSTDSYGISVEEAIQSGIRAVASNVCERAEGTYLFESRNLDDFELKIFEALNCQRQNLKVKKVEDYLKPYISLYNSLLEDND